MPLAKTVPLKAATAFLLFTYSCSSVATGTTAGRTMIGAGVEGIVSRVIGIFSEKEEEKASLPVEESATVEASSEEPQRKIAIRWASIWPEVVRPGEKVEARVQYEIPAGNGPFDVHESRCLLKEGVPDSPPVARVLTKGPGLYLSTYTFTVPPEAVEGMYAVRTVLTHEGKAVAQVDAAFRVERIDDRRK